jgi:hypothetical protein
MPHVITRLANPVVKGLSTCLPEDHVVAGGVTEIHPSHHLVVHPAVHLELIRGEIRVEVNDGVRNAQGPPKSVTEVDPRLVTKTLATSSSSKL